MLARRVFANATRTLLWIDHHPTYIVAAVFTLYLLVGLHIYADYGVHTDEYNNQNFGIRWGHYVEQVIATGEVPAVVDTIHGRQISHNLCHGPFWELVLYGATQAILGPSADSRDVLLLRHLANFLLFFVAVLFFYAACRQTFQSYWLGLLSALLLVLNPRTFADSFYNTVDLAFLSFYAISMYTLLRWRRSASVPDALWHALACAALVATRAAGLIVPFLTTLLVAGEYLSTAWSKTGTTRTETGNPSDFQDASGPTMGVAPANAGRRLGLAFGVYSVALTAATILFWPFLWRDTVANFLESVQGGLFSEAREVTGPWYNVRWLSMTLPLAYLALFSVGLAGIAARCGGIKVSSVAYSDLFVALFLFGFPLVATVLAKTSLFNGWRHHYFVYPPFVVICVFGAAAVYRLARRLRDPLLRLSALAVAVGLPILSCGTTALFLVRNHPFQFAYANLLSETGLAGPRSEFMQDYWMVSHRQALEHLLACDGRDQLAVYFTRHHTKGFNINILPADERAKLRRVEHVAEADYVIGDWLPNEGRAVAAPYGDLVYTIRVDQIPITCVYKREPGNQSPGAIREESSLFDEAQSP